MQLSNNILAKISGPYVALSGGINGCVFKALYDGQPKIIKIPFTKDDPGAGYREAVLGSFVGKTNLPEAGETWVETIAFGTQQGPLSDLADATAVLACKEELMKDEMHYIIVQDSAGKETLAAWMATQTKVSDHHFRLIAFQLMWAVYTANCKWGVVHSDIKPENIMVTRSVGGGTKLYAIKTGYGTEVEQFSVKFEVGDPEIRIIDMGAAFLNVNNTYKDAYREKALITSLDKSSVPATIAAKKLEWRDMIFDPHYYNTISTKIYDGSEDGRETSAVIGDMFAIGVTLACLICQNRVDINGKPYTYDDAKQPPVVGTTLQQWVNRGNAFATYPDVDQTEPQTKKLIEDFNGAFERPLLNAGADGYGILLIRDFLKLDPKLRLEMGIPGDDYGLANGLFHPLFTKSTITVTENRDIAFAGVGTLFGFGYLKPFTLEDDKHKNAMNALAQPIIDSFAVFVMEPGLLETKNEREGKGKRSKKQKKKKKSVDDEAEKLRKEEEERLRNEAAQKTKDDEAEQRRKEEEQRAAKTPTDDTFVAQSSIITALWKYCDPENPTKIEITSFEAGALKAAFQACLDKIFELANGDAAKVNVLEQHLFIKNGAANVVSFAGNGAYIIKNKNGAVQPGGCARDVAFTLVGLAVAILGPSEAENFQIVNGLYPNTESDNSVMAARNWIVDTYKIIGKIVGFTERSAETGIAKLTPEGINQLKLALTTLLPMLAIKDSTINDYSKGGRVRKLLEDALGILVSQNYGRLSEFYKQFATKDENFLLFKFNNREKTAILNLFERYFTDDKTGAKLGWKERRYQYRVLLYVSAAIQDAQGLNYSKIKDNYFYVSSADKNQMGKYQALPGKEWIEKNEIASIGISIANELEVIESLAEYKTDENFNLSYINDSLYTPLQQMAKDVIELDKIFTHLGLQSEMFEHAKDHHKIDMDIIGNQIRYFHVLSIVSNMIETNQYPPDQIERCFVEWPPLAVQKIVPGQVYTI